jgi:hypothetical protein
MLRLLLFLVIFTSIVGAVEVPVSDSVPQIDGVFEDPAWQNASVISDFYQQFPKSGEQPIDKTEVRLLQDCEHLYLGIICYGDTTGIVQRQNKRDTSVYEDDSIEIFISTIGNEQCYFLVVNSLNIQADGIYIVRSGNFDYTWDGIWESAVKIEKDRWVLEIAIPYRSLRYGRSDVWKFNIVRYNQITKEATCPFAYKSYVTDIKNYGELSSLKLPHNATFDVIPYGMLNDVGADEGGSLKYEFERKGGIDLKTNVRGNTTVNFTLNPDYAQIESDPEEINLSKEEILLPEKRPFFLEGADEFNLPHRFFYSRRISDIWTGTKAMGEWGRTTFGLLHCYMKDDDVRFPGANVVVGRMRVCAADGLLLAGSYAGAISDVKYNHLVIADGEYDITNKVSILGSYGHTFTQDTYVDSSGALLKERFDGWEVSSVFVYRGTHCYHSAIFFATSPDIDPELGYLQYPGIGVAGVTWSGGQDWGFSSSPLDSISLEYFSALDRNIDGGVVSFSADVFNEFKFKRNWGFWLEGFGQRDAYLVDEGEPIYENGHFNGGGYVFPVNWAGTSVGFEYGKSYEYERYYALNSRFAMTPYPGLDVSFGPQVVYYKDTDGKFNKMWVFRLKTSQTIGQWFTWRFIVDGDYEGYYTFAGLVGVTYQPGSTIYIAYQEDRQDTDTGFMSKGRTIFLKGSYDLRF